MSGGRFYDRWAELPPGTKFRTTYQPGMVFVKTSRHHGLGVVCLTDGKPNRVGNIVNPLGGFDRVIEVIDFKALAAGVDDPDARPRVVEILRSL